MSFIFLNCFFSLYYFRFEGILEYKLESRFLANFFKGEGEVLIYHLFFCHLLSEPRFTAFGSLFAFLDSIRARCQGGCHIEDVLFFFGFIPSRLLLLIYTS